MASLNKAILLGNLTRTPELRYTPSGAAICEFGLAMNRKFTQNNEQKDETCFVNVVVWGKSGEACQRHLEKGSPALIEGRLQYDQWDDRETGKKRSTLRVIAERVQFVGSRQDNQQGGNGYQPQGQQSQGYQGAHYNAQQQPQGQQGGYQQQGQGGYQAPQQQQQRQFGANERPPQNNGFPEMPNDMMGNDNPEDDIPF